MKDEVRHLGASEGREVAAGWREQRVSSQKFALPHRQVMKRYFG